MLEILVTKPFSVSQNPTWRPRGHWCYLIVFHVREEVTSFLGFLLGISVMQEFYLVANPQEYKVATGRILQGQCAHLNQR